MKTTKPTLFFSLLAGLAALVMAGPALADAPPLVNYQGKVTDTNGVPLPSGTYTMEVRVWDRVVDMPGEPSILVWGRRHDDVEVVNGLYSVVLGTEGEAIAGAAVNDIRYAFGDPERFLGVTVVSDAAGNALPAAEEISPRQQILSAPFAISALNGGPVGTIVPYAGDPSLLPDNWQLCDGTELPVADHPALFAAVGTTYGSADSGTFRLPDLRGRTVVGAGQAPGLSNRIAGQELGSETKKLTAANLPDHTHGVTISVRFGTTLGVRSPSQNSLDPMATISNTQHASYSTNTEPDHLSDNLMRAEPVSLMQPSLVLHYIIRIK